MTAALTDYWTTTAVTALSGEWINVSERSDPAADGSLLMTSPCSAILLQERRDVDGDRETRAVAAMFEDGVGVLVPACDDSSHYATAQRDDWESLREDAEREVRADRDRIEQAMLRRLADAGDTGIAAAELVRGFYSAHRAVAVRESLERDGQAATVWQPDPAAPGGKVCVYRLA